MHHLPISESLKGQCFVTTQVDEGGRGGGSAQRSSSLLVWSCLGESEKQSVARTRLWIYTPSRRLFCWMPRPVVHCRGEGNWASDASHAAASPDAGMMGNS